MEQVTTAEVERFLFTGLVRAVDWLDTSLQNVLRSKGFRTVRRTQSLILLHIANGIDSPGDIGRSLGISRQNVHQVSKPLINAGILVQTPDPADPRRTRYGWAETSADIRTVAISTLGKLDEVIQQRAGLSQQEMDLFRKILMTDWGSAIADAEALDAELRAGD